MCTKGGTPSSSLRVPEEKKKAVVYQVPCKDCCKLYTGESKRTLKVRLAEHKRAVQKSDVNNCDACSQHQPQYWLGKCKSSEDGTSVLGEENYRSYPDQEEPETHEPWQWLLTAQCLEPCLTEPTPTDTPTSWWCHLMLFNSLLPPCLFNHCLIN